MGNYQAEFKLPGCIYFWAAAQIPATQVVRVKKIDDTKASIFSYNFSQTQTSFIIGTLDVTS